MTLEAKSLVDLRQGMEWGVGELGVEAKRVFLPFFKQMWCFLRCFLCFCAFFECFVSIFTTAVPSNRDLQHVALPNAPALPNLSALVKEVFGLPLDKTCQVRWSGFFLGFSRVFLGFLEF